uniref:Solute carrier family 45 member 3 n=1 Tax=Pundamilia nyererei TaxID=303518 RepID=A0A3B4FBL9_9CICH
MVQICTLFQILLLVNTLSCGLEVCMAAGTVYIPPLLLQAGMEERYMTMMLAVTPVLGLIFIPMIGSASDSWRGRFGRRTPFIWILSLGVLLGLQIIPQARRLTLLISPQHPQWVQAGMQAAAVCLVEFCAQACLTLLLALLSDLFPGDEENRKAFSVNSLMTSLGGCLGFLLPSVDWSQVPIAVYLGGQEAFVYTLLTLLFFGCLLSTTCIKEEAGVRGERKILVHPPLKSLGSRCCPFPFLLRPRCLRDVLCRRASEGLSMLHHLYAVCTHVPQVIWRLFVAEVCSWMALMSVMLFFADFMGEGLYQGVPGADPESQERKHYDEGVRMASLALFLQCAVSVLCSTLMDRWVALLGAKVVYTSGVALLLLATTVMSVTDSVMMVTVMAAVTGYTLCVLQVLPYTLLCLYHSDRKVSSYLHSVQPCPTNASSFFPNLKDGSGVSFVAQPIPGFIAQPSQPPQSFHSLLNSTETADCFLNCGHAFKMLLFSSAYLQLLPAMCLGSIVQLTNSVRAYMACACCFSLLALLFARRVVYSHIIPHAKCSVFLIQ